MSHHHQVKLILLNKYQVPHKCIITHFTHAHGHGGQNVNKNATKVQLRVELFNLPFSEEITEKLLKKFPKGHIETQSQRTKHQHQNLEIALEKMQNILEEALV